MIFQTCCTISQLVKKTSLPSTPDLFAAEARHAAPENGGYPVELSRCIQYKYVICIQYVNKHMYEMYMYIMFMLCNWILYIYIIHIYLYIIYQRVKHVYKHLVIYSIQCMYIYIYIGSRLGVPRSFQEPSVLSLYYKRRYCIEMGGWGGGGRVITSCGVRCIESCGNLEDVASLKMLLRCKYCIVVVYRRGVGGCNNVMWSALDSDLWKP